MFLLKSSWPFVVGKISKRKQRPLLKKCKNILLATGYLLYSRSQETQFNSENHFHKTLWAWAVQCVLQISQLGSPPIFMTKQKALESMASCLGCLLALLMVEDLNHQQHPRLHPAQNIPRPFSKYLWLILSKIWEISRTLLRVIWGKS